jgi:hypothetical protein
MDSKRKERIARGVGFATGGVGAIILTISTREELTGSFDIFKVGFVGGIAGYALGYALARAVIMAFFSKEEKKEEIRVAAVALTQATMVVALWRSFVTFVGYFVLIFFPLCMILGAWVAINYAKSGGADRHSVLPVWISLSIILGILGIPAVGAFILARRRFRRFEIVKK